MRKRLSIPEGLEQSFVLAAAIVWAVVAATRSVVLRDGGLVAATVGLMAILLSMRTGRLRTTLVVGLVVAAAVSGIGSAHREATTLEGVALGTRVTDSYRIVTDAIAGRWGDERFLGRSSEGLTLLFEASGAAPEAGQRWFIEGVVAGPPGRWRGIAHAGEVTTRSLVVESHGGVFAAAANAARHRVNSVFGSLGAEGGLVSGFLIGETSRVGVADLAAMRAAGLSHFVAVSGSNVALFLGLWWIVTFFAGFDVRTRAVAGLIGLVLFVWITRWEPSVVRAAVMAALVLASRAVGVPLTGWSALGAGVAGVALVSGELVHSVGFQLSVAATCGVLVAHRAIAVPVVGPLLSATTGAQLAVAPLLIAHFGSVPLVSPIANLLSVPLVTGSTGLGVVAALLDWELLAAAAAWLAGLVLGIAHVAAGFPQIGGLGLLAAVTLAAAWRWAPVRVLTLGVGVVAAAWLVLGPPPVESGIIVLDVGQGDSILLLGDEGGVVLVDGGPDQELLVEKLRTYRVRRIDLIVNTHPHHDHSEGLIAAIESVPVGMIWRSGHVDDQADELARAAAAAGIATDTPSTGTSVAIGGVELEVLGPLRRYVSPNDQSIVMMASVNDVAIALVGDIEMHAQADLGPVAADVLKVPHQGAATSDEAWLRQSAGQLAVISVGPNQFGHPDAKVVEILTEAGATVVRTDHVGDVVITSIQDVPVG